MHVLDGVRLVLCVADGTFEEVFSGETNRSLAAKGKKNQVDGSSFLHTIIKLLLTLNGSRGEFCRNE